MNAFGTSSGTDLVTIYLWQCKYVFLFHFDVQRFIAVNRGAWLNFLAIWNDINGFRCVWLCYTVKYLVLQWVRQWSMRTYNSIPCDDQHIRACIFTWKSGYRLLLSGDFACQCLTSSWLYSLWINNWLAWYDFVSIKNQRWKHAKYEEWTCFQPRAAWRANPLIKGDGFRIPNSEWVTTDR